MIPDGQKVISKYLREHPAVAALGAKVVSKTPTDQSTEWVRVTELDAPQEPGSRADHLVAHFMQFDCYATEKGGLPEAATLARTVRAALVDIGDAQHEGAVITGARISGYGRFPDGELEPARERYIITATVWAHALPA